MRVLRAVLRTVLAVVAAVALYLGAAAVGGLVGGLGGAGRATDGPVRVGLVIGPIHTDLLIPLTPAVRDRLAFAAGTLPFDDPRAEWLVVGWGARQFYTTTGTLADINAPSVFWGIVGDDPVLRLDVTGRITDFTGVPLLSLDEATLARLVDRIAAEVPPGAAPLDHPGFTQSDVFYPATGGFHALRTCNVWMGEVLRDAGIAWGVWTPTPQAVRLSLWRFHPGAVAVQAAAGSSASISATIGKTRSP